jgi:hypothetical protein
MKGFVVYHHDEQGWHWNLTHDGKVISTSSRPFLTRRGAMDDWNSMQRVVERFLQYGERENP